MAAAYVEKIRYEKKEYLEFLSSQITNEQNKTNFIKKSSNIKGSKKDSTLKPGIIIKIVRCRRCKIFSIFGKHNKFQCDLKVNNRLSELKKKEQ